MLNIENIGDRFVRIVNSQEWSDLQEKYNSSDDIYVLGHGGNMGVADHTAIDMTRLSNGTKNATCPGSCVVATSLINDTNFEQWMAEWLGHRTSTRTPAQIKRSLVYGISASGTSKDVIAALKWASENGMQTSLITSKPIAKHINIKGLTQVVLGADYYHTAEVLSLLLQYQLTHGSGNVCPPIGKNSPEDIRNQKYWRGSIREHSYPDELINIGIDFDGVIHKNSKGYHDGTIYDEPFEGVREALERLSSEYQLILFTTKAKPDRGLINGRQTVDLIWEWLEKYDLAQFITTITAEKPRGVVYLDDKGLRFTDWKTCMSDLEDLGIIE
jgi:phosphoheptose isomerase